MSIIVIQSGNVLDLEKGVLLENHHVVIENDRIVEVTDRHAAFRDARIIDAAGKTVMPGLIDCHVRILASIENESADSIQSDVLPAIRALPILDAMLSNGFTSVRDTDGAVWAIRRATEGGLVPGPRIFPSGVAISKSIGHTKVSQDNVNAARRAARDEIQKGATQVEIMGSDICRSSGSPDENFQYSDDEIHAIIAEAEEEHVYAIADLYTGHSIARAARCGVRTIEHGNLVDRSAAILMRERKMFAVPTVIAFDALAKHGASYGMDPISVATITDLQKEARRSLEVFANSGVSMGFGSDLPREMHALQCSEFRIRADILGNLEALRSATTIAADILNMQGQLGTIAVGAIADLLIISGNPLDDIEVLAGKRDHIEYILQRGRVVKTWPHKPKYS